MAPAFVPAAAAGRAALAIPTPAARVCVATAAGRRVRPAAAAAARPAAGRGPPRRLVSRAVASDAGDAAGDAAGDSGGAGGTDKPTASAGGVDGVAAAGGGGVDGPSSASPAPPAPAPAAAECEAEGALENLEGAFDASLLTGLQGALDRDWDRLEASFFSAIEGAEKAKEQEASEVEEVEIPRAPVPMPVRSFGGGGDAAPADGDTPADGETGATAEGGLPGTDAAVLPEEVAAEDAGATAADAPPGSDAGAGAGDEAAAPAGAAPKAKRGRKKKAPTLLAPTGAAAGDAAADGSDAPSADGGDELGFVVEKDMFLETAEDHRWYSLQVKPGTENSVRIALQNMCVAVPRLAKQLRHILVPSVAVQALTKSGKQVTREERLFPGYMLVCMAMDRQSYQDVRSVTHVQGFMGDPNREKKKKDPMRPPDAISAEAIAEINAKLAAAKLAVPPPPGGGVAAAMGYAPADPAAAALAVAAAGVGSPTDASFAGVDASAGGADGAAAGAAAPVADAGLQAGDTVRIETGAHAGEEGVITLVNPAAATVRVTLDIFGVATPVDVAAADVVRAAAPPPPMEDDPEFGMGLADL